MKKLFGIASLAPATLTIGLALSGCQSQAQKEVHQQAKAVDESYKAQADITQALAAGSPNAAEAKNQADNLRELGDRTKKHLDREADHLPKQ